jgi:ATP-binding cassette, subfamily B, bacterial
MKGITDYVRGLWFALGYSFKFVPGSTAVVGILYALNGTVPYVSAFLLGTLVNSIVDGTESGSYGNLLFIVFLYSLVSTLPSIFSNIQAYQNRKRMLTLTMETDIEIYSHRERIDIATYENPKFQDLIQRAFRNGANPIFQLSNAQFYILRALVSFVVGTLLSLQFSPVVYLMVIASAIPAFIMDVKYAGKSWSIWAKDSPEQRRLSDLRSYFSNRVRLIESKLLQTKPKLFAWIRKIYVEFSDKQIKLEKSRVWQTSIADIIALSGFAIGFYMVVKGTIDGETTIGGLVYIMTTLSGVRNSIADLLSNISNQYENTLIALDIKQFVNTSPHIKEVDNPTELNLISVPEIVFEDVSFKYPNSDAWILKNINLTLKPGNKIGLVGNNGAGKTTFVKLLCRVYDPTEGRILVNGVDLRELALKEWWSYLSVMFQDYSTYEFKVKEAIAMGRPDAVLDMGKVRDAADVSQSTSFIEEWGEKFDEQIGVDFGGKEPSKGQRQKLSIAKVIYRNALIMVLDEPTASVDAESEAKIFDSLESLSADTTALFISHDFSTISECDQIFVIEKGELIEEGDHKKLMKLNGKYAELYNLQAERFKK